jgi:hypothetical protein
MWETRGYLRDNYAPLANWLLTFCSNGRYGWTLKEEVRSYSQASTTKKSHANRHQKQEQLHAQAKETSAC